MFAALDVKTGQVIGKTHTRHRSIEFRKFLNTIDDEIPKELEVHLVVDNYSTHETQAIRNWFAKHPRFHVHFTPTYSSWINQVERFFAELTNKPLRRGSHRTVRELKQAIQEFLDSHNKDPKPYVWTKSADEILASISRFAQRTTDVHSGTTC